MKCQILFSRSSKKNIISLSSVEIAHSMVSIEDTVSKYGRCYSSRWGQEKRRCVRWGIIIT